jgi:hypothetical protein
MARMDAVSALDALVAQAKPAHSRFREINAEKSVIETGLAGNTGQPDEIIEFRSWRNYWRLAGTQQGQPKTSKHGMAQSR